MLVTIALAAAFGLALLAVGLRGRRVDDHPLCRRCRFDLTGRPAESTRCPECGADLGRPRATVVGHRQRMAVLIWTGRMVTLVAVVAGTLAGLQAYSGVSPLPYAPAFYVRWEVSASDPDRSGPALAELVRRYAAGRLSASSCASVADAALARQRDLDRPWDSRWGDLLERMRADGRLSDDRWVRYAEGAIPGLMRLDVRPTVRRGDRLPIELTIREPRVGSGSALCVRTRRRSLTFPDAAAYPFEFHDTGFGFTDMTCGTELSQQSIDARQSLEAIPADGQRHEVTCTADVQVGTCDLGSGFRLLASGQVTASDHFVLLTSDQPTVVAVPDPTIAADVRRTLTVTAVRSVDRAKRPAVELEVSSNRLTLDVGGTRVPVDVSFDVLVRVDGQDEKVGELVHGRSGAMSATKRYACPPGAGDGPFTVVFRADPTPAAGTPTITRVWGGEIVFPNVPISSR